MRGIDASASFQILPRFAERAELPARPAPRIASRGTASGPRRRCFALISIRQPTAAHGPASL